MSDLTPGDNLLALLDDIDRDVCFHSHAEKREHISEILAGIPEALRVYNDAVAIQRHAIDLGHNRDTLAMDAELKAIGATQATSPADAIGNIIKSHALAAAAAEIAKGMEQLNAHHQRLLAHLKHTINRAALEAAP